MHLRSRIRICCLAVFLTVPSSSPEGYLQVAREQTAPSDKIAALRKCLREFPASPRTIEARDQLVTLLMNTNRYEEALQIYREKVALRKPSAEPDLQWLELLLKTGRTSEVIRLTATAPNNGHDVQFDKNLFERRVQAFLAQGRYAAARQSVDQWLGMHGQEGEQHGRFALDVQNLQRLRRYLLTLERTQGTTGKPLFTASVADSWIHKSRVKNIPIVFFMLVPADPQNQADNFKHGTDSAIQPLIRDINLGLRYLSGGTFSLQLEEVNTLYIKPSDFDPSGPQINLLASRVYIHTIPPLYRLAGRAFVVLVDYRAQSDEETAYMGDGLIHITADKLHSLPLMHEILHGLGATHQDWTALMGRGYRFDPEDRGLMTFTRGELRDLGLEEKNRILLGWPHVAVLHFDNETAEVSPRLSPTVARILR